MASAKPPTATFAFLLLPARSVGSPGQGQGQAHGTHHDQVKKDHPKATQWGGSWRVAQGAGEVQRLPLGTKQAAWVTVPGPVPLTAA